MKKYEKYKDSGVEWIGAIPIHWEILPFKRHMKISNGCDYKAVQVDYSETSYPVIGSGGQFAWAKSYLYEGEAVLLGRKGTIDKPLFVNNAFWTVDTMFYSVPNDGETSCKYMYYQALGFPFGLYATSTALPSMTQTDLANNLICVPPLNEQKAIASYLDSKCSRIDEMISAKTKQMDVLKEYRTSLISEVVTKGLNPEAKMKESKIKWAQVIPAHWSVCKLQYVVNLSSGNNLTSDSIKEDGEYPVYGGNGIRGYYSDFTNEGDYVLIGRQGALCGNINYASGKFWATEHAVVCYPKKEYVTRWLGELLRTMNLNQYSIASAQPGLAVERIKRLQIPVPPISEQQAIAEYLDEKCSKIEDLLTSLEAEIQELKRYKTSIISEAVTGKVKVF